MNMDSRCPKCGALIVENERYCPRCGAPLTEEAAQEAAQRARPAQDTDALKKETPAQGGVKLEKEPPAAQRVTLDKPPVQPAAQPAPARREDLAAMAETKAVPRTIEQLQAYCDSRGMPLEKMRFFIGEDYRQARAFGIYRDGDRVVVYKNKADGSRAVRYSGPDEAHAVKELFDKLLSECHARDIWPDGKPADYEEKQRRGKRQVILVAVVLILMFILFTGLSLWDRAKKHAHDGYYRYNDRTVYYRYGDDWYYDSGSDWYSTSYFPYDDYEDYYLGSSYDSGWGVEDFKRSDAWEDIQESERSSSSDYDSWDSFDTDWDSDW